MSQHRIPFVQSLLKFTKKATNVAMIYHRRNLHYNKYYEALFMGTITFFFGYVVGGTLWTWKVRGAVRKEPNELTDFERIYVETRNPANSSAEAIYDEAYFKKIRFGKDLSSFEWFVLQHSVEKSPQMNYHVSQLLALKKD